MKKILLLVLFVSNYLFAVSDILKSSEIFIDKAGSYTIENIQDAKFEKSNTSKIHRGYTDESIWIKFSIKNDTNKPLNKVLVIDNQMLDSIILYTGENNTYKEKINGIINGKHFDEYILDFYFNISLDPNQSKDYYLKVSSLSCAVYFTLELMIKEELYRQEMLHQLALTLFFGSMLTLILYNLFIFIFTKDLSYLYYVLYIFFLSWNHSSYTAINSHLTQFLPTSFIKIDAYLAIYYLVGLSIFALLFTRTFLNIKKYKKIDLLFKIFLAINLLIVIFTSKEFYPIDLVSLIALLSLIIIILSAYYLYYKKEVNTKYFIWGWSIALFGWITLALHDFGYESLMDSYPYFYEIAMFIEAILFSMALSNKLNKTKELEQQVNKNTILTKELHHRVKNNMQFIIAMYRLKFSKFLNDKLKTTLNETEGSIQAMSSIHEMLYEQNDLKEIDAKKYFNDLIDRFKNSFHSKDINISLDVSTSLEISQSITLGIIINEMLTNSFKYAFPQNKGEITLSLKKTKNEFEFIYWDNGIGFELENSSKSFGLRLIQNLIKDELKADLSFSSSSGTSYSITWK